MRRATPSIFVTTSLLALVTAIVVPIAVTAFAADTREALAPDLLVDRDGEPRAMATPLGDPDLTYPTALRGGGDHVDPGLPPEGDYLGWPAFTRDGQRILLSNRDTDNVTVFDAATMAVLANVALGDTPSGIAVSDDLAVVACAFSDEAWIIDLTTLTVAATIPTAEQPWVVRVSPDGTRAYVACDIPDVCEIIDLTTLSHVGSINGFPISLLSYSWGSENGRWGARFTGFEVTPDGQYLVVGDRDDSVDFFDTTTGLLADSVTGVADCTTVGLSGDGTKVIALSASSEVSAHQIDLVGPTLLNSVLVRNHSLSTHEVGVNQDGSKAFLGISGNSSAFVDFGDGGHIILTSTYTPFSIGTSPDHALALGIQYRFSVLDFASETLVGQWQGISTSTSAVSPVGTTAVAFDALRDESLNFYDYSASNNPQWVGATPSGLGPEGDAPRRVAITPDGTRALVTNVLSDNTSIIDLSTGMVTAILPTGDRPQDLAITADSRWAVVTGMDSHSVFVIDLDAETVVAEVPTGLRPGVVSIEPDDSHAWVGNIQGNTVSKVLLDGAASTEVAEIYCGVIGVSWAAYGVSSAVLVSPDGAYCLVAASFDDQLKVIDTSTNTIVASLPTGDFPLQIACEATSEYATVTNWFGDSVTIVQLDGASSSVVGNFPHGDGPLRLAYNPAADVMGIAHYYDKTIVSIDPRTGAFVGSQGFADYGNLLQCGFEVDGRPLALTAASGTDPAHFHASTEAIPLPAAPSYFADDDATGIVAIVMPGPDFVTLVGAGVTAAEPVTVASGPGVLLPPGPNPGGGTTAIAFRLADPALASVTVYDVAGRRVADLVRDDFPAGLSQMRWDGRDARGRVLPAGTYFVELRIGNWHQTRKMTRVR